MKNHNQEYLDTRKDVFGERKDKFVCLMDLALIAMRKLKKEGKLDDQRSQTKLMHVVLQFLQKQMENRRMVSKL